MKKPESTDEDERSREQTLEIARQSIAAVPDLENASTPVLRDQRDYSEARLMEIEAQLMMNATPEGRIELESEKALRAEWLARVNRILATRQPESPILP
jgi:hypothetical protein